MSRERAGTSRDDKGKHGAHAPPTIPQTPPRLEGGPVSYPSYKDVAARAVLSPIRSAPSLVDQEKAHYREGFRHFLNNYGKKEGGMSFYQMQAEIQARQGGLALKVNFNDLLKYKKYVNLAIWITGAAISDPHHSWLQPIAQDFLTTHFKLEGDKKLKPRFCFINMAKSVKPLSEYKQSVLVKQQSIYDGKHQVLKTSHKGRHVYLSVLNYTLAVHRIRKSWNGEFNMADIYIVEYKNRSKMECLIYANTRDLNENDYNEKVRDLQMVNTLLTPKFQVGNEYPAYFVDLKADLEQLTCSKLRDTGFVWSLPFHLALMSPAARSFLLSNLHLAIQRFKGQVDFSSLLNKKVRTDNQYWWREYKSSSDAVLRGVYLHNNNGSDKFSNNVKGMFDYQRHLIQHDHHHLPKGAIRHVDESELFAALKVPLVLPIIVNDLFSGASMKFKNEFGSVWSDYCKMCYNEDEDNVTIPSREMPSVLFQDGISP